MDVMIYTEKHLHPYQGLKERSKKSLTHIGSFYQLAMSHLGAILLTFDLLSLVPTHHLKLIIVTLLKMRF